MTNLFYKLLLFQSLCWITYLPAKAQTYTISGPTCVFSGVTYTYTLSGVYPNNPYMYAYANGGVVVGGSFNTVNVIWPNPYSIVNNLYVYYGASPQHIDVNVASAGGIAPATFTVNNNVITSFSATGSAVSAGSCTFVYQWESGINLFSPISGANSQDFTFSGGTSSVVNLRRKVYVAGDEAHAQYSGVVSFQSKYILSNADAGTLSPSALASCSSSPLYHWEVSSDGLNYAVLQGPDGIPYTGATYNPGTLTASRYYRLTVNCSGTSAVTLFKVTVMELLAGGVIDELPADIPFGGLAGTITSQQPATGGSCNTYTYQWQQSVDGVNFTSIDYAADGETYCPEFLYKILYFRRMVTCDGQTAYSNVISVTPQPDALHGGSINTTSAFLYSGVNEFTISSVKVASGGCWNGIYIYQWQKSADNVTYSDITGANDISYTTGVLDQTTYFRRKVTCGNYTAYSNVTFIKKADTENYIREQVAKKAGLPNQLDAYTDDPSVAQQSTLYFDGWGRLAQTVVKRGSIVSGNQATDLVSVKTYDNRGRESDQYLPFASEGTDGSLKMHPLSQLTTFYQHYLSEEPGETVNDAEWAFSKTNYESSPLSRVKETFAPGANWVGTSQAASGAAKHVTKQSYWSNTATDAVAIFKVTDIHGEYGFYNNVGTYAAGELYKTVTTNEGGKQVIEFKDKEGLMVLKKVQLTAQADEGEGSGYVGWLCTYYIYDDLSRLRAVILPKGVEALYTNLNWTPDATLLSEQCFRYTYDARGRLVLKKVPGTEGVYMVYDVRDRLVFMQDGNLRMENKWLTTLYDPLNRPVITGLISYTGSRDVLQQLVTAQTQISGDSPAQGEDTGGGITGGVIVNKNPLPEGMPLEVMTVTYYDNHNWTTSLDLELKVFKKTSVASYLEPVNNSTAPYAQAVESSIATEGLVTGTKVKILGSTTAQYLTMVNFYDEKARLIQTRSENITNGIDVLTMQYNWSGQPLVRIQEHEKKGDQPHMAIVATRWCYDEQNRVTKIKKKISSSLVDNGAVPGDWTTIVENEYDALGQLKTKKLGNKQHEETGAPTGEPLVQLDYTYNIRGWLTSINKDYLTETQVIDRYFGMELGYDKNGFESTFTPQYTGNISGTIWKNAGDGQKRKYDFGYDPADRLTGAAFGQYQDGPETGPEAEYNTNAGIDFSVTNLSYDANGNIQHMKQKGLLGTGSQTIDHLSYHYYPGSNKLRNVIDDATNDPQIKLGDFRVSQAYLGSLGGTKTESATDYTYDANGNLIKDLNKDIDDASTNGIEYNHLNLPKKIHIKGKGTIEYTYDAMGSKIRKTVTDQTTAPQPIVTTTLYINGFEYKNNVLQQITQEEGRIRYEPAKENTCSASPIPARLMHDYFIKDHLGNTRMVLTEEQEKDCYPAATIEPTRVATEKELYNILDGRRVERMSTGAVEARLEEWVYRTHGGVQGENTGLEMVLKVMSGDKVFIKGDSYYTLPGGNAGTPLQLAFEDLLAGFVGGGPVSGKGITVTSITDIADNAVALASFLNGNNPGSTAAKAAVNWILLDEQFKFVAGDFDGVQPGGGYKEHTKFINAPVNITKSGYLYIYVSNESNLPVFFDNLQVTHRRGAILETTDYYPFGLTMAGISSNTLRPDYYENRYKFNNGSELQSKEFSDGAGLELYSTQYRSLDPQLGRWWQIDPKSESSLSFSPYVSMNNNPLSFTDPLGDIVEYEREDDITRRELRMFKKEIRQMRRSSESFNKMFKDMKSSNDKFVYKASSTVAGGNTAKPWEKGQNGVTTISVNVRMNSDKVISTTAHETGHGWRVAQKLDVKPEILDQPSMPGIMGTKQDWDNYNKQNDYVKGKNLLTSTESREQAEVGAMHIANIVTSELRSSGNSKYSNLSFETIYFGPSAIPDISSYGNPTYVPTFKDYINKVPLDYYKNRIDIHKEYNVNPIK